MKRVLLIGSGRNAVAAASWPKQGDVTVVSINNAWRVRPDWDYLVYADDWPLERRPPILTRKQTALGTDHYVEAMARCGGIVFGGATMAFAAAYWSLVELRPDVIGFIGCDMDYAAADGNTHFYGAGSADPLRGDKTLRDLYAKSARFHYHALARGCSVFNLSAEPFTRLSFARSTYDRFSSFRSRDRLQVRMEWRLAKWARAARGPARAALSMESEAPFDPSDRHFARFISRIDDTFVDAIDRHWRRFGEALPPSLSERRSDPHG